MYEAMMTLTDPQKKCLKDMGFERMVHFLIVELPSALAYHAIDHFHLGSMELRLEKGSIKATRQKVHDMLGIPMGSRKLEDLEERPSNDPFIKEWEKEFKHVPKPTPAAITLVISDTTEADFMFRMNFITLFGSTMGTLDNGGRVLTKLLKRITEDVDISDIDWCGYILDCLQTSKKNWKDVKTQNNFYYGPLKFLCFDPEEEQDGRNVYKGLDVYVPPINDKEPETKEEYKQTFNDAEFNLYESSNDEDSEGDVDGDNDKNNNDDDGAPTADANKIKESEKQKKKRNKEEIDKQTEESGSEGTEESGSKGTEENGKKDANETEDNDKMNNNKIDNVEENQGDHKDETGEDEFWNTQFTNSQCEELENQAKEEIKKKKIAKRKSTKEITPPSFSLATKGNAVHDEMMICSYLFSMEGSEFDFIFETKEGNATIRDYMQTLAPTLKIESNVIDTYCLVLNHEQGVNSKRKKTKHFFHTGMITKDMFNWKMEDGKKYDEVKQYKAFSDTMKNEFKKDDEVKKLKDLEMAFFPIIAHEHYYLVVFNFLKGTTVIIDNSKTPMSYEAKYKKVCDVLKNMFSMHLKEVQHPRAKDVLNKKPTILRPKWGTEENNTDYGVFLMMHDKYRYNKNHKKTVKNGQARTRE
ncbi:ulp1 protease family, C-terminal catalytic domain-containing protein [Tanacetum coccineum]